MAQSWRYQNGLYLPGPNTATGGLAICRWLFEFATRICGWTAYDTSSSSLWTDCNGTGTNGASVAGHSDQFSITGDAYNLSASDVGRNFTITGMTGPDAVYNGIYKIVSIIDSKTAVLDIKRSVHEVGIPASLSGLSWRLWENSAGGVTLPPVSSWAVMRGTYRDTSPGSNIDVYIASGASGGTTCGTPAFIISPSATWNNITHAWATPPPGYTISKATPVSGYQTGRVWAIGDQNVIIVYWLNVTQSACHVIYLGEITPYYPASDTKPAIVGYGVGTAYDSFLGNGATGSSISQGGGAMLAADNVTTISPYLAIPDVLGSDNTNRLAAAANRFSGRSKGLYRLEITVMSVTSGNQEWRGKLIGAWATGMANTRLMPFGSSLEYFHTTSGLAISWNGSKSNLPL